MVALFGCSVAVPADAGATPGAGGVVGTLRSAPVQLQGARFAGCWEGFFDVFVGCP